MIVTPSNTMSYGHNRPRATPRKSPQKYANTAGTAQNRARNRLLPHTTLAVRAYSLP